MATNYAEEVKPTLHYQDLKNPHKAQAKTVGKIFAGIASISVGITGAAALASTMVFAGAAMPWVIVIFGIAALAGIYTESSVFWKDTKSAFGIIFGQGINPLKIHRNITENLENKILLREYQRNPSIFDTKKLDSLSNPTIEVEIEKKILQKKQTKIFKQRLKAWYQEQTQKKTSANIPTLAKLLNDKFQQPYPVRNLPNLLIKLSELFALLPPGNDLTARLASCATINPALNKKIHHTLLKAIDPNFLKNKKLQNVINNDNPQFIANFIELLQTLPDLSNNKMQKIETRFVEEEKNKKFKAKLALYRKQHANNISQDNIFSLVENNEKRATLMREYHAKRILLLFMPTLAIATGISFGAFSYNSIIFTVSLAGIAATGFGLPIIAAILAVAIAFAYGMWMYTTLSNAVKQNVFRRFKESLKSIFIPTHSTPEKKGEIKKVTWKELSTKEKIAHLVTVSLKLSILFVFVGLSIFITLCTGGTYLKANQTAFSGLVSQLSKLNILTAYTANIINLVIIWGGVITAKIIFILDHVVETAKKITAALIKLAVHCKVGIAALLSYPLQTLKAVKNATWSFIASPSKMIPAALTLFKSVLIFFHFSAEAATDSLGVQDPTDALSKIVDNIARNVNNFLQVNIPSWVFPFSASFIGEVGEDIDFIVSDSKEQSNQHTGHHHNHSSPDKIFQKLLNSSYKIISPLEFTHQNFSYAPLFTSIKGDAISQETIAIANTTTPSQYP